MPAFALPATAKSNPMWWAWNDDPGGCRNTQREREEVTSVAEQITHEAEISRQHARYKIPAKVQVDDYTFSLKEWSVSGLSADHIPSEIGNKPFHQGTLLFDTGEFTLSVPIEFEVRRFDPETGFLGARFVNLSKRNLSLLHYIINAYLSGEVIAAGDILDVAGRENFVKKDLDSRVEDEQSALAKGLGVARQVLGYALMLTVLIGLVSFIVYTVYERLFVVESVAARVQGDVVVLRAPDNGVFELPDDALPEQAQPGQMLGIVKLVSGGAASIANPCDCRVLDVHSLEGAFVGRGEPLFTLMPRDGELTVSAQVPFSQLDRLSVGQSATVRLTDGRRLKGRIERIEAARSLEAVRASPNRAGAELPVAEVRIATEETISPEMLDTVATVTFSTFGGRAQ